MVGTAGAVAMDHDFHKKIYQSNHSLSLDDRIKIYNNCFGEIKKIEKIQNIEAQKRGIDFKVENRIGKFFYVEEKVRLRRYPDFLIEYLSNAEKRRRGWVYKIMAQYLIYISIPEREYRCMSAPAINALWRRYGRTWKAREYRRVECSTERLYTTVSLCIPWEEISRRVAIFHHGKY